MKWLVHFVFGLFKNMIIHLHLKFCFREHLQEVISLLSNEPKNSSLPLNENKDEQEHEETTFLDTVKLKNSYFV